MKSFKNIFFLLLLNIAVSAQVKIACIGNSITSGGGPDRLKNTYPGLLENLLGAGYEVKNFGVSGRTLLSKGNFPYINEAAYQQALAWLPNVVTIKLGTNDSKPVNWIYKEDFDKDYTALINSFKNLSSHPRIILLSPVTVFSNKVGGIDSLIVQKEIFPLVKGIAQNNNCELLDLWTPTSTHPEFFSDGVHPTIAGAKYLSQLIFNYLQSYPGNDFIGIKNKAREKISMDRNWKFHFGDASDTKNDFNYNINYNLSKAGAGRGCIASDFNDADWRSLDLPHDWAVEQDFANIKNEGLQDHGFKAVGGLFPKTSIGWYRKQFFIAAKDSGNKFEVHFDGVFRNCKVYLNGHYLGNNESGYSEFSLDVTDYINFHKKNVLVVRVDASQYEGWFYEGAGIYRHVWLEKFNTLHVAQYGSFVSCTVKDNLATVAVDTKIMNAGFTRTRSNVVYYIADNNGNHITGTTVEGVSVNNGDVKKIQYQFKLPDPIRWSLENPYCYQLVTLIKQNDIIIDSTSTTFGIRTIRVDAAKGLFLNDKPIKIHGVCCHQDHAGVGSALPDALQYYRIRLLKEMGVNVYRTSHNPPTPELLQACDALGMLVLDENRLIGTSAEYMSQFTRLIDRDKNHPSVFMWSIGNEEGWIHGNDVGRRMAQTLLQKQKEMDPSRTSTYAADNGNYRPGINEVIPVRGFNYRIPAIDAYHEAWPNQPVLGSETGSTLCTRGIYVKDTVAGYVPDHDITYPWWASTAEQWWKPNADKDWFMGGFVWTGFDYRGEPTPYGWPCINSHFGIMDMCGFPKNNYYYYQSWWSEKDVLQISPHWNAEKNGSGWKLGDSIAVWVNSNAELVELKLNGKSLGTQTMEKNGHLVWKVKYTPGKLEAFGKRNGRKLYAKVETTGPAYRIMVTPDKTTLHADGEDLCIMNITVTDKQGREIPDAMNLVKFTATGNARIIGVGNGDPGSHEPDKYFDLNWQRKLFNGKCQVIVQSTSQEGSSNFMATAEGLQPATVILQTKRIDGKEYVLENN
jgi:beta-galactosidase